MNVLMECGDCWKLLISLGQIIINDVSGEFRLNINEWESEDIDSYSYVSFDILPKYDAFFWIVPVCIVRDDYNDFRYALLEPRSLRMTGFDFTYMCQLIRCDRMMIDGLSKLYGIFDVDPSDYYCDYQSRLNYNIKRCNQMQCTLEFEDIWEDLSLSERDEPYILAVSERYNDSVLCYGRISYNQYLAGKVAGKTKLFQIQGIRMWVAQKFCRMSHEINSFQMLGVIVRMILNNKWFKSKPDYYKCAVMLPLEGMCNEFRYSGDEVSYLQMFRQLDLRYFECLFKYLKLDYLTYAKLNFYSLCNLLYLECQLAWLFRFPCKLVNSMR